MPLPGNLGGFADDCCTADPSGKTVRVCAYSVTEAMQHFQYQAVQEKHMPGVERTMERVHARAVPMVAEPHHRKELRQGTKTQTPVQTAPALLYKPGSRPALEMETTQTAMRAVVCEAAESARFVKVCPTAEELQWVDPPTRLRCPVKDCKAFPFKTQRGLTHHMNAVHHLDKGTASSEKVVVDEEVRYHCPENGCRFNGVFDRWLTSFAQLKSHYVNTHEKRFSCRKCSRGFGLDRDRKYHEGLCGEVFACTTCPAQYSSRQALMTHCARKQHPPPAKPKKKSKEAPTKAPAVAMCPPLPAEDKNNSNPSSAGCATEAREKLGHLSVASSTEARRENTSSKVSPCTAASGDGGSQPVAAATGKELRNQCDQLAVASPPKSKDKYSPRKILPKGPVIFVSSLAATAAATSGSDPNAVMLTQAGYHGDRDPLPRTHCAEIQTDGAYVGHLSQRELAPGVSTGCQTVRRVLCTGNGQVNTATQASGPALRHLAVAPLCPLSNMGTQVSGDLFPTADASTMSDTAAQVSGSALRNPGVAPLHLSHVASQVSGAVFPTIDASTISDMAIQTSVDRVNSATQFTESYPNGCRVGVDGAPFQSSSAVLVNNGTQMNFPPQVSAVASQTGAGAEGVNMAVQVAGFSHMATQASRGAAGGFEISTEVSEGLWDPGFPCVAVDPNLVQSSGTDMSTQAFLPSAAVKRKTITSNNAGTQMADVWFPEGSARATTGMQTLFSAATAGMQATTGMQTALSANTGTQMAGSWFPVESQTATTGMQTAFLATTGMQTANSATTGMQTAMLATTGMQTAISATTGMQTAFSAASGMQTAISATTTMPTLFSNSTGMQTSLTLLPGRSKLGVIAQTQTSGNHILQSAMASADIPVVTPSPSKKGRPKGQGRTPVRKRSVKSSEVQTLTWSSSPHTKRRRTKGEKRHVGTVSDLTMATGTMEGRSTSQTLQRRSTAAADGGNKRLETPVMSSSVSGEGEGRKRWDPFLSSQPSPPHASTSDTGLQADLDDLLSIYTSDFGVQTQTDFMSVCTAELGVQTLDLMSTGEFGVQTQDLMATGEFGVQTQDMMFTGEFGVQTQDLMSTGEFGVQTQDLMSTGEFGVQTQDLMATGEFGVQTQDMTMTGEFGVQTHNLMATGEFGAQTQDMTMTGEFGVQTQDLMPTVEFGVQTHTLMSTGELGVQTQHIMSTGELGVQTQDLNVKGTSNFGVQAHNRTATGEFGIQTHNLIYTGEFGVQTHDIMSTGEFGVQTHDLNGTGTSSYLNGSRTSTFGVQTHNMISTGELGVQTQDLNGTGTSSFGVQTHNMMSTGEFGVQTYDLVTTGELGVQTQDLNVTGSSSFGVQTHSVMATGEFGVQTHNLISTEELGVQTQDLNMKGTSSFGAQTQNKMTTVEFGVQTHNTMSTGELGVQTQDLMATGELGVQTHDMMSTGEFGAQTQDLNGTETSSFGVQTIESSLRSLLDELDPSMEYITMADNDAVSEVSAAGTRISSSSANSIDLSVAHCGAGTVVSILDSQTQTNKATTLTSDFDLAVHLSDMGTEVDSALSGIYPPLNAKLFDSFDSDLSFSEMGTGTEDFFSSSHTQTVSADISDELEQEASLFPVLSTLDCGTGTDDILTHSQTQTFFVEQGQLKPGGSTGSDSLAFFGAPTQTCSNFQTDSTASPSSESQSSSAATTGCNTLYGPGRVSWTVTSSTAFPSSAVSCDISVAQCGTGNMDSLATGTNIQTQTAAFSSTALSTFDSLATGTDIQTQTAAFSSTALSTFDSLATGTDIQTQTAAFSSTALSTFDSLAAGTDIQTQTATFSALSTMDSLAAGTDMTTQTAAFSSTALSTFDSLAAGTDIQTQTATFSALSAMDYLAAGTDMTTQTATFSVLSTMDSLAVSTDMHTQTSACSPGTLSAMDSLAAGTDMTTQTAALSNTALSTFDSLAGEGTDMQTQTAAFSSGALSATESDIHTQTAACSPIPLSAMASLAAAGTDMHTQTADDLLDFLMSNMETQTTEVIAQGGGAASMPMADTQTQTSSCVLLPTQPHHPSSLPSPSSPRACTRPPLSGVGKTSSLVTVETQTTTCHTAAEDEEDEEDFFQFADMQTQTNMLDKFFPFD